MSSVQNTNTPAASGRGNGTGSSGAFQGQSAFTAAFERRLGEIKAVREEDLLTVNLDVHGAVATVLGALPEILALRNEISKLPQVDVSVVDSLEDYAMAAGEANSRYATAIAPQEDILALNEEALKLRETLRSDATALAHRGLIDPARLTAFKGLIGYKNVAFELIDWANLIQDCWARIQGKTALTPEELAHAKSVGERLVRAAGLREQGPAVVVEAARIRQQAFTLLVKAYDEVRRGVVFLRWKERDADRIALSLYAGKVRAKREDNETPPQEPPQAPAPADTSSANSGSSAHAATSVGLPGAPPFAAS